MPHPVDLPQSSPVFADLLAVALYQLGYAVLPPRRPDTVGALLDQAGQCVEGNGLFEAATLQKWEPCLLCLRLPPRDPAAMAVAPVGQRERAEPELQASSPRQVHVVW